MRLQFFSSILLAIVGLQGHLHAATPVDSVTLESLVAEVPPGTVWHRVESKSQRAVFGRTADGKHTTLSISEQPIRPLPEDHAFQRFAEDQQAQLLSKLEMVSVHYNRTQKKGAPCVAYDGIYRDKADQVSPFLSFRGQLCRHPDSAGRMIQVELAQRSSTKKAAYKIDLFELSEAVFGAVKFTELPKESQPDR
jgi:hypothetical protein